MDKIQATGNRNKVLTGGMIDVAQDGSVLQGVYAPAVLVRNEAERDALPADYPPGTIAFTPGQAQKWQKTQDGGWADYVGGSGSSGGGSGSAQYMAIFASGMQMKGRLASLDTTVLASGSVVEAVGIPAYVSDVTDYAAYGITDPGWYVFARVTAEGGVKVTAETTVTGAAGYIAQIGADHVDVAVKFEVAALSRAVEINWGLYIDTFIFKASDLAVRNLDYRTTFYVYDLSPYAQWTYAVTSDATFAAGKNYYVKDGSAYTPVTFASYYVQATSYTLTADATFQEGTTYYTKDGDVYTEAEVTVGDPVPLYVGASVPALYYEHSYTLTADETFTEGKAYYTEEGGVYTQATVTAGEAVTENTYYEDVYTLTEDAAFVEGKAYYTKSGTTYTQAEVTAGQAVPTVYYVHSKITFSGMTRNVTYKFDEPIDCPSEFILPVIEDEIHGAWFELRLKHTGAYSSQLIVPEGVKVATEHTQAETAGLNTIQLHYNNVDGTKLWRFLNTHSTIPA